MENTVRSDNSQEKPPKDLAPENPLPKDPFKPRRALMDRDDKPVVILGGKSVVAPYLLRRFAEKGRHCQIVSRNPMALPPSLNGCYTPVITDLGFKTWKPASKSTIISLLPLWVMADNIELIEEADVLIAIGSANALTQKDSLDPKEREHAQRMIDAEERLRIYCAKHNILLTILRPTMMYDGQNDKNIARIVRLARKMPLVPVAGKATGLRQPIHADDVADAVMRALDTEEAVDRDFTIAGGEVLTFREILQKTYDAHGIKPNLLSIPTAMLESGIRALGKMRLIKTRSEGYALFRRMNDDMVYDIEEGLTVLQYNQRTFKPKKEEQPEFKPKRRFQEIDPPSPYPME